MVSKVASVGRGAILVVLSFVACQSQEPSASEPTEPPPAVVELSPAERLDELKSNLLDVKAELNEQGEYNCCVKPSCDWCALHEGSCQCFNNIQEGEAVCPGCGLGWHNGQGVVDGVESGNVKWNITHEHPSGGHEH